MRNFFIGEGKLNVVSRAWLACRFGYKAFKNMKNWHLYKGDSVRVIYDLEVK